MKALLVLAGDPPPRALVEAELPAFLVAVDGGGNLLRDWGLRPDAVVGDMDSIEPGVLAAFEAAGSRILRHPRDKLHSDAQLALDLVLGRGAREVVLAGSTGRRLDQTLANLELLLRGARAGARVRCLEATGALWSVAPGAPLELALAKGRVFSVLPLTPVVEGVRVAGARWPLPRADDPPEGARMEVGDPYGLSNEAEGRLRVEVARGVAVVVVPS